MPPKKKEAKPGAEATEGEDPLVLNSNYVKYCKSIGLPACSAITRTLTDDEKYPIEQLVVDDETGPIGPGGTRALMTAVMGSGPGMKGGPYKLLKYIRIWRSNVGDDGAAAIAEVLRLGGADVKIAFLELLDDNIGPKGAAALGGALSVGLNLSLLTLNLDYNGTLGTDGVRGLCRGLRTNCTLKQLHLCYVQMTSEAGGAISDLLQNTSSNLTVLTLTGNRLGGAGLAAICHGLLLNKKLEKLGLADNMIEQSEEDLYALELFKACLLCPTVELTAVDLMWNRIGEAGGLVLAPALTSDNKRISEFLVDLSLPMPLFEQLCRRDSGKKKKGKGKKGKKK